MNNDRKQFWFKKLNMIRSQYENSAQISVKKYTEAPESKKYLQ